MEFFRRAPGNPVRLGVFPGTFNPPTRAHLELVRAALTRVDEVVFVLPRVFPHKAYSGASFEERVVMLETAARGDDQVSIAATERGLFIDIAAECRQAYHPAIRLSFLCGRDAAERVAGWDYGRTGAFAEMLDVFDLLVASRDGDYRPPELFRDRIHTLDTPASLDEISATRVREQAAQGGDWQSLVPAEILPHVAKIYTRRP